jgi:hypothetical protein
MDLSLNSWAVAFKGDHRVLPETNSPNAGPDPDSGLVAQLREANVVSDDLMPSRRQGSNQSRLPGTGLADKSNATVRNVNGGRVEGRESPLMAQHPKSSPEQINLDRVISGRRHRLDQNFVAVSHQKQSRFRKIEQHFLFVGNNSPNICHPPDYNL